MKIIGICIVDKSIIEIPTNAIVMVEKIMASKAGKFINDQTQGIGHNSSRKKLLLLILKLSTSTQFIVFLRAKPEAAPKPIGSKCSNLKTRLQC